MKAEFKKLKGYYFQELVDCGHVQRMCSCMMYNCGHRRQWNYYRVSIVVLEGCNFGQQYK